MKRILALLLCFLMVFAVAACSDESKNETKETEESYKIIERELLTPEIVIEKICELGNFDYTLQTPGCNEVYDQQINLSEPVVKSYRISDNETGEYVQLLCLATEDDAKMTSNRYSDFDYTKRLGAMYLFGTADSLKNLSFSDYKYPESFEPENAEAPDPQSVAGIVKSIEDTTELYGGYYSDSIIEQTKEKLNARATLNGDILNIVHLTYHDGSVLRFVYIYEFENEEDAVSYEEDRSLFAQSIEDGLCIRIGTKVIYGNHNVISNF